MPQDLGPLKDLAQDVVAASAALEGRVAQQTALALGDQLRLLNSYYSNLIEGHRTHIPDIQKALELDFHAEDEKRYPQELCAAHVQAERRLMEQLHAGTLRNVSSLENVQAIHREFYSQLPPEHQYTHEGTGFTTMRVLPGQLRDVDVSVGVGRGPHGPSPADLEGEMKCFGEQYDPTEFHGDERLIAMAASHHRLTWLHPFRDGNGRTCRLHSGLFLAQSKINRGNLWSLSRGLSRNKNEYMINLFSADPAPGQAERERSELLADFCRFFLEVCLDQIQFMRKQLRLEKIEQRIEWYVHLRSQKRRTTGKNSFLHRKAARLLRAAFMQGRVQRGEAPEILNTSATSSRRIVSQLLKEGLLTSATSRQPLSVALPMDVMPYYFPNLYDQSMLGSEYMEMLGADLPF